MSYDERAEILEELGNRDERHDFIDVRVKQRIALLIRNIRKRQGLSQEQLAEKMGKHQTHIARLEKLEYGGYAVNSLLEVFKALDVALFVDVVAFSEFLELTEDLTAEKLNAVEFTAEREQVALRRWARSDPKIRANGDQIDESHINKFLEEKNGQTEENGRPRPKGIVGASAPTGRGLQGMLRTPCYESTYQC
jgi:transcriptional regulator with XRE-family HTH domain